MKQAACATQETSAQMNISKICEILDKKANEFINLFSPQLANELKTQIYFAGGCIYSLWNHSKPKDYDIFLKETTIIETLKNLDIWAYISEYALSYGKYQIVTKYHGEPLECVGEFDFAHNMYYYIPLIGDTIHHVGWECENVVDDIVNYSYLDTKELIFNECRSRDVEGVYLRINKFLDRGMTISKETKKAIKKKTTKKAIRKYKRKSKNAKHFY